MFGNRGLQFAMVVFGASLFAAGCGPTYPKCENDEHCAEKGEVCVNGLCTECRDNEKCAAKGPGFVCRGGKCARDPNYCDANTPCPPGSKCRDNQCGAECLDNSECGAGTYCEGGRCITKPQCGPNADNPECPEGQDCIAGRCQVRIATCNAEPVYFAFDRAEIRASERAKLEGIASCLKGGNTANVQLAGHADERGTEEYNLALGERRAESVRRYLLNLGVDSSKLSTISYGEERPAVQGSNEGAWSRNRRVEFNRF